VKKHVNRRTAPKVITRIVRPNTKALIAPYAKRVAVAEAAAADAERRSKALEQRVAALERKAASKSAVAVPGFGGKTGDWERWRTKVEGKLGKLGKAAGVGAFLLLLAKSLEKMGANWIRCSNSKRYGKSICGMDSSLLEGLIADALLIVGAISIVEFAKELQAIEGVTVAGLRKFVREI
jgi:hypothetical protein